MAEQSGVYTPTTEPATRKGGTTCCVWLRHLKPPRFAVKVLELVLSFMAFICEELVEHCENCGGLYFFEFVSCTAFLLCIVVIVVYCTTFAERITLTQLKRLDLYFTAVSGLIFMLASIIFASTKDVSTLETTSVVFGFFASFIFLVDCGLLWRKEKAYFCNPHQRKETPPNEQQENAALNDGNQP